MRALVITKHGPPEVLRVQERPDPTPGQGEVRVRVRAAGVSFADTMARVGLYPDAPKPPAVVGYEFAGEVDAVGPGVEGIATGARVMGGSRFGCYAELVVARRDNVLPLPESWSFEQGAAFPVNYSTAWAAVSRYGALRPEEALLVHAAAGGVGIAAIQVARALGAGVAYGTSSASKHVRLREFGFDHPIDYRSDDFVKAVRRISGEKEPLDLVLDAVGGKSFKRSFSLLRPGGRLVCYGASAVMGGDRRDLKRALRTAVQMPRFNPMRLMTDSKSVIGLNMLRLWDAHQSLEEYIVPLRDLVEEGKLEPVVAESFPFDRGAEAHRFLQEGRNVGKVVLTP